MILRSGFYTAIWFLQYAIASTASDQKVALSSRTLSPKPLLKFKALLLLTITFILGNVLMLRAEEADKPSVAAGDLPPTLHVDGKLDEEEWSKVKGIETLTMVEPIQGGTPSARTIVKILANSKAIAFGIKCENPASYEIVSFSKQRDADLLKQDHIRIVLDSFQDGRSGYVFALNPSGARFDALIVSRGEEEDPNWDGIWESATSRDANGWSAEILIPINTITFKKGSTTWNFNVQRGLQGLQETDRWASPEQDYQITQMSRAGYLTGLPNFDLGWGLSVRPSVVAGGGRPAPESNAEFDKHASLDVTKRLGPNLLSFLTVNTDFAETEADALQINLTRFPLFFPEKRTFFLEGSDIFDFGLGLGQDLIPFFSRTIGLVNELEVPLRVGGKLYGRAGQTNVGALAVHTGEEEFVAPATDMGVLRLKQNIFGESSVGMIGTVGDPEGRNGSWMAGGDFTYQTSNFQGDKNFLMGVWGLTMDRSELQGDKQAYGMAVLYPNDLWDASFRFMSIGDSFDPSLGFVPRTGIRLYDGGVAFQPRPEWSLVRQMFYELFTTYITDMKNEWQTYEVFMTPVNWRLENGDRFEFNFVWQGDRPNEPFEIAPGVIIPAGAYQWRRYRVELETASKRKLRSQITWGFGDYYDGTLSHIVAQSFWNPSGLIVFELNLENDVGHLTVGDFTENLIGARIRFNLSPNLQVSSFLQYDSQSKRYGSNTRMIWNIRPNIDLFVIYNHNFVEILDHWLTESNQLLVKFQYTFRK
jgi:Domain of unknown function (DUF5916)